MSQYRSNSVTAIEEIFALEGDSLARHGFEQPDLSRRPEEYAQHIARTAFIETKEA